MVEGRWSSERVRVRSIDEGVVSLLVNGDGREEWSLVRGVGGACVVEKHRRIVRMFLPCWGRMRRRNQSNCAVQIQSEHSIDTFAMARRMGEEEKEEMKECVMSSTVAVMYYYYL
jgi:hypothetical protein